MAMSDEEALARFREIERKLPSLLSSLLACPPHRAGNKPTVPHHEGVYLFTEAGKHLYVGRTGNFNHRLGQHTQPSSPENSAPFAYNIAKREAKLPLVGTRVAISRHAEFVPHFQAAKARIRQMEFRYVVIDDAATSTIFEVYAAIALATEGDFNLFSTH